jgi:hypothetical protein
LTLIALALAGCGRDEIKTYRVVNIVTSWLWFGVNMLGIGLHSYGFTDAAFKWLVLFVVSQIGFIVLGSLPSNMWKSFQTPTQGRL